MKDPVFWRMSSSRARYLIDANGGHLGITIPADMNNFHPDVRADVDAVATEVLRRLNTFPALLAAGEALLADADAVQGDQEACRRLCNAWKDLRAAVNQAKGQ